jgi:4-hydroxybenzoate polyprenyltransferase
MTLLALYVRMLRYRVALMMWLFMLLAVAEHGALQRMPLRALLAAVALGSSYVGATTANDIADMEIDLVNHPRDRGRPLVSGDADERALWIVHGAGNVAALAASAALGRWAVGVALVSIAISYAYSIRPVRLSYRTYLAPVVLAAAYVLVPYAFGVIVVGASPTRHDLVFAGSLYALFIARIVLKDFRDRDGDSMYGKPTLLLRFGKVAVCRTSLAALLTWNASILVAIRPPLGFDVIVEAFVVAIWWQLRALERTDDGRGSRSRSGSGRGWATGC